MSSSIQVAFVRAVMVGREGLGREELLDVFREAGASEVVSYLATGNVSFRVDDRRGDDVAAGVEAALGQLLGRPTPVFLRTSDELRALVSAGPFDDPPFPAVRDRIVVLFRGAVPQALQLPVEDRDGDWVVFERGVREVFAVTRARADGRHPGAPGGVVERLAGEPVTSRAWSTIERIVTKLP